MKRYDTTQSFINSAVNSGGYAANDIVETQGYYVRGGVGGTKLMATGNVIAASQDFLALNDVKCSDASGNEFQLVVEEAGIIDLNTIGGVSAAYINIAVAAGLTYSQGLTSNPNVSDRYIVATVSAMVNRVNPQIGEAYIVSDRGDGIFGTVAVGTTPNVDLPNTGNIIVSTTDATKCFVLRSERLIAAQWGVAFDGSTDNTLAGQAIIDYCNTNKNGPILCDAGTCNWNVVMKSDVTIEGTTLQGGTIFSPVTDDHVFSVDPAVSTVRIGFKNFKITGDVTFSSQDGIHLETTTASTFVDTIVIEDVFIEDCGQRGLHAIGTSTSGPFVQGLTCRNLTCRDNIDNGIRLEGAVLESSFSDGGSVSNGDVAGTIDNFYCGIESGSGQVPKRVSFDNFRMNHAVAALDAGYTSAIICHAMNIVGAQQITFNSCDLENANPMIGISNALSKNITAIGCNFGSAEDAKSFIEIDDVTGLKVINSDFAGTGVIDDAFINQGNVSESRVKLVDVDNTCTYTAGVKALSLYKVHTISGGGVSMRGGDNPSFILIDTEAAAATDDLDNLFDINGGEDALYDGIEVNISTVANTRDVTITTAGNFEVAGASVVLDNSTDLATFVWSDNKSKWLQKSLSNNA